MVAFARQYDPLGNWTNFKQDTDADSDWELDLSRFPLLLAQRGAFHGDDRLELLAHGRRGVAGLPEWNQGEVVGHDKVLGPLLHLQVG